MSPSCGTVLLPTLPESLKSLLSKAQHPVIWTLCAEENLICKHSTCGEYDECELRPTPCPLLMLALIQMSLYTTD